MQLLPEIDDFAQKRAAFRRKRHARFFIELFFGDGALRHTRFSPSSVIPARAVFCFSDQF